MIRTSLALFAASILLLLASAVPAQAQVGAYASFTVDRLSGLQSSPIRTPGVTYNDHVNPLGFLGGVYYDFRNVGPVRLGVDLRGSVATTHRGAEAGSDGAGARIESGLAGVRAVFHTPVSALKPYAQASAGIGRTNYGLVRPVGTPSGSGSGLVNNFEYHVYAGVDIKVLPFLDFRAVELGYGGLDPFGTNGHNYPLKSIASGIVFHLPTLP